LKCDSLSFRGTVEPTVLKEPLNTSNPTLKQLLHYFSSVGFF